MKIIIIILAIIGVLSTLIPFSSSDVWWVRMFDFPGVQVSVILGLSLLGFICFYDQLVFFEKILALAALLSLIYKSTVIYPYTPLSKTVAFDTKTVDEDNTIRLLSSNVLMTNREYHLLLSEIHQIDPDIVMLLETDQGWKDRMDTLKQKYPYAVSQAQDNTYGMLMYSKYKLIDPRIDFLIEKEVPSIDTKVALPSGQIIQLYCIHPTPPSPTENDRSTERDAELMIVGKKVAKDSLPTIVAGDLNDVAWSSSTRLFLNVSEMLDPRIGRGFYNTFNAKIFFLRWPLDHFFHSSHFKLKNLQRLSNIGSDHFPIYIELVYEPIATLLQEAPKVTAEDKREADQQIEKAKEKNK